MHSLSISPCLSSPKPDNKLYPPPYNLPPPPAAIVATTTTMASTPATTSLTTTLNNIPFNLLQINVISAHDLPPLAKSLRTYVVARAYPDHKLSTPVDHNGHINPMWNYRMVFRVDDKFFRSNSSTIVFDIYNIAWLRDLPIGTTRLPIDQILLNNPSSSGMKPLALQICQPSGHLKGILNVSFNLVNNSVPSSPVANEIPISTIQNRDERDEIISPKIDNQEKYLTKGADFNFAPLRDEIISPEINYRKKYVAKGDDFNFTPLRDEIISPEISDRKKYVTKGNDFNFTPLRDEIMSPEISDRKKYVTKGNDFNFKPLRDEIISPKFDNQEKNVTNHDDDLNSNFMINSKPNSHVASSGSIYSEMQPLPSEIMATLNNGIYSINGDYTGSSIFDNWTAAGDQSTVFDGGNSKNIVRWADIDDQILLVKDDGAHKRRPHHRSRSDGGGLFSCFGKGFECTFICGSSMKNNKKMMVSKSNGHVKSYPW